MQPPTYYHLKGTLLSVLVLYVLYRLSGPLCGAYRVRKRWSDIPSLPRHPLWGNIINAGRRMHPISNRHVDYGFEEIWRELGEPSCFLIDFAPLHHRAILVVAEPHHADLMVNSTEDFKYSLPKESSTSKRTRPLLGTEGITSLNGARWRATRKRFSPDFQPQYTQSLTKPILARMKVFVDRLQALADTDSGWKTLLETSRLTLLHKLLSRKIWQHSQRGRVLESSLDWVLSLLVDV